MTRGDIYRHREDGDLILVGDVNELAGTCDDCRKDMGKYELVGNLIEMVKGAGSGAFGEGSYLIDKL